MPGFVRNLRGGGFHAESRHRSEWWCGGLEWDYIELRPLRLAPEVVRAVLLAAGKGTLAALPPATGALAHIVSFLSPCVRVTGSD